MVLLARGPHVAPATALFAPVALEELNGLHEAAHHAGATAIVACDPAGFSSATLRVYAPAELLRLVRAAGG